MRARRSISVSTPPRLVALRTRRTAVLAAPGRRAVGQLEREHAARAGRHLAPRELVLGVIRQARVVHGAATSGCAASRRASSPAVATWRGSRTCSVRRPRSSSQAGSGASTPPIVRRTHTRRSRSAESRVVITPASSVGVAGEVLRRALPGEVGAEVERALQERRPERVVAAQERAAGVRGAPRPRAMSVTASVGLDGRLDDRERRALAGAAEAVGVAQVVAAHLDAEAREHLGAEQLDLVVAARRDHERLALPEHRRGRGTSRPSCRSRRASPRRPRGRRAAPRPRPRPARARARRASRRPARARTSSSGRARGRARATGCRRDRARAASRAPCPKHSTRAVRACPSGRGGDRGAEVVPEVVDVLEARRTGAAGPRARDPRARCARGARSASRRRRGWSRSARAARASSQRSAAAPSASSNASTPPQPSGI